MNADPNQRWLRGPAAATAAHRSEATVRKWVSRGQVECRKRYHRGHLVNEYREIDLLECERDRRRKT